MSLSTKKFRTTTEEVEYVLSKYPEARNNDFVLQWFWLKEVVGLNMPDIPWQKFQQLAGKLGTIRRTRQKIQGINKYLPSDKRVLERRKRWRMIRMRSNQFSGVSVVRE
ncbi:MAG: hypothetical protein FJ358_03780 [Thaumarchaeota archaeon]|nr:hypothetical protein [Nitrososphaerota archaeon]